MPYSKGCRHTRSDEWRVSMPVNLRRAFIGILLGLVVASLTLASVMAVDCEFVLGFKTLRDLIGHEIVGECLENEHYNENGDSIQATTGGLLVWRIADNHTAFTDGYHTWISGPNGLQKRLNTERFPWEPDYAPDGGIATPTPPPATPTATPMTEIDSMPLPTPTPTPVLETAPQVLEATPTPTSTVQFIVAPTPTPTPVLETAPQVLEATPTPTPTVQFIVAPTPTPTPVLETAPQVLEATPTPTPTVQFIVAPTPTPTPVLETAPQEVSTPTPTPTPKPSHVVCAQDNSGSGVVFCGETEGPDWD